MSLHQQGRLREAEKLYARALKAAPDNFDALHLLGLIKAQSGQMGEAYRLMSAALKINPNAPDALINIANVLHALKRDAEALECLDKALAAAAGRSGGPALSRKCAERARSRRRRRLPASTRCWRAIPAMATRCSIAAPRSPTSAVTRRRSPISMPCSRRRRTISKPCTIAALRCSNSAAQTEALAAFDSRAGARATTCERLEQPRPRAASAQPARRSGRKFRKSDRDRQGLRRRPFQSGAVAAHARRTVARLCGI